MVDAMKTGATLPDTLSLSILTRESDSGKSRGLSIPFLVDSGRETNLPNSASESNTVCPVDLHKKFRNP